MTVVVSDASPLNYLVWIGCEHVLPKLYERILVPAVVLQELEESGAPEKVAEWTTHLPEWINVSTDHRILKPLTCTGWMVLTRGNVTRFCSP